LWWPQLAVRSFVLDFGGVLTCLESTIACELETEAGSLLDLARAGIQKTHVDRLDQRLTIGKRHLAQLRLVIAIEQGALVVNLWLKLELHRDVGNVGRFGEVNFHLHVPRLTALFDCRLLPNHAISEGRKREQYDGEG